MSLGEKQRQRHRRQRMGRAGTGAGAEEVFIPWRIAISSCAIIKPTLLLLLLLSSFARQHNNIQGRQDMTRTHGSCTCLALLPTTTKPMTKVKAATTTRTFALFQAVALSTLAFSVGPLDMGMNLN